VRSHAVYYGLERPIGSVPALVSVHGVVATAHRRYALHGQLGQVVKGGVRRYVTPVRKRVDPRLLRSEAKQRLHVLDVRMDAAVGDQSEQMHVLAALERRDERRVLVEGLV